jgi:hypothetical protein
MIEALIAPVTGLLDKFVEDKDQKNKLAHELATMADRHAQELAKGQLEINKAEASHRSIFVAGWRPFLGWILASAMGWHFIFAPVTIFVCAYLGVDIPELPVFDMDSLMTVLLGMLGLGGLRTAEKIKGVTK